MSQKIYVGNLSFKATEEEVRQHFSKFGNVLSVIMVNDRETGRPRGFGFVEMDNIDQAVASANGSELGGRRLVVNQAKEREPRPPRY